MDLSATRKGRSNHAPQAVRSVRKQLAASVCLITGLLFAGFAVLGAAQPQVPAPSLKVVPSSGPSGTAISITGEDFTSNGSITDGITIDGVSIGNPRLSLTKYGFFFHKDILVLGAGSSPKTVTVTDSDGLAGSAIFMVTRPTITLSHTTAAIGEDVTITGAGWVPLSSVFITLHSNYHEVGATSAVANAFGDFALTMELPRTLGIGARTISFDAEDSYYLGNTAQALALKVPAPNVTIL